MAMTLQNDAHGTGWTIQKASNNGTSWLPNYVAKSQDYVNSPPVRQDFTVAQRPAL